MSRGGTHMEAIRMEQVVAENGRIVLEGLPVTRPNGGGNGVVDQPTLVHQPKTVRELL